MSLTENDAKADNGSKASGGTSGGTTEPRQISIVIPTFNRAELLRSTLDSLVDQSLPRDKYEVIVVDNGSRDVSEADRLERTKTRFVK